MGTSAPAVRTHDIPIAEPFKPPLPLPERTQTEPDFWPDINQPVRSPVREPVPVRRRQKEAEADEQYR